MVLLYRILTHRKPLEVLVDYYALTKSKLASNLPLLNTPHRGSFSTCKLRPTLIHATSRDELAFLAAEPCKPALAEDHPGLIQRQPITRRRTYALLWNMLRL